MQHTLHCLPRFGQQVTFTTENCVTSADAYPLDYQLSVLKEDGSWEILSEKNSEPSFTGVGKPRLEGNDTRVYVITVSNNNTITCHTQQLTINYFSLSKLCFVKEVTIHKGIEVLNIYDSTVAFL